MPKQVIVTTEAPAAIGPYSQAIRVGNLVFVSGQIPLHPQTGEIVGDTAAEQARQVLQNLQAVLQAAGASLQDVVKTTIFLTDLGQFAAVNAVYAEFFPSEPPARSTVQVAALPRGVQVEIEAVAVVELSR
ncbi:MAG: RidA family protein [Armatimonadota bacterium]|nr:RidA family protein [Armatimonadota bacterium]MDW8104450.1 RidA family protein [Armatimonadota bacterium]